MTLSVILWTIYLLDLVLKCTDELYVFLCILIVALLENYFCFVTREASSPIQVDFVEAFSSSLMYLADFLNINNPYGKADIPHETSVNKINSCDTEALF